MLKIMLHIVGWQREIVIRWCISIATIITAVQKKYLTYIFPKQADITVTTGR